LWTEAERFADLAEYPFADGESGHGRSALRPPGALCRQAEDRGPKLFRRLTRHDLEFTPVLEQFGESLVDELAWVVAEGVAHVGLDLTAGATLATAEQLEQALGRLAPERA